MNPSAFQSQFPGHTNNFTLCNPTTFSVSQAAGNQQPGNQQLERNYAFVDAQNLYMGTKLRGWKIHLPSFRRYLRDKYQVAKAIVFIGYIKGNEWIYDLLQNAGFLLEFRQTRVLSNGKFDNGNCDCDLVAYALDAKNEYDKAVIIANDSDYISTIQRLSRQQKLKMVISPQAIETTSYQIKKSVVPELLTSIQDIRSIIEFRKRA